MEGNPEAKYWVVRHRLRTEFGLTASEADVEPYEETMIHLKIWDMVNKRQEREQKMQELRSRAGRIEP